MKNSILSIVLLIIFSFSAIAQTENKRVSKKTHFKFYSHTVAEDIEAHNYKSVGTINTETGDIVFSVPMQSFEFEKSLMQKHYNSKKFLNTKTFPKAKLKGKITNLADVNLKNDGSYDINVEGELTIHGVTKAINEKATLVVKGSGLALNSTLSITLDDYGIAFKDGKPSTNIAKTLEITVVSEY